MPRWVNHTFLLFLLDSKKQVIGIVCHHCADEFNEVVVVVALVDRTLCQTESLMLAEQFVCRVNEHLTACLGVGATGMVECLAPCTGRVSIKVRPCRPNILYRSLDSIGTIVERALAEQAPRLLHHGIVLTVACNGIVVYPRRHIGFQAIHPGELEDKVIGHGSLFDGLGSSTDTLDAVVFGLELKVVVGHVLQAAHES